MAVLHAYRTIQESLASLVGNISGVGRVLLERPRVLTDAELKDMFGIQNDVHDNKYDVNVWFLEWLGGKPSRASAETSTYYVNYRYALTGFYSFKDNSEEEIRNTAELIMDTLAVHLRAGINPATVDALNVEDLDVDVQNFGMDELGPVFCSTVLVSMTAFVRRVAPAYVN